MIPKLRSIASPLTIASFIVAAVTGLCMSFGYRGGLVNPMHEAFTLVFVAGCILHIIVNWKAVVAHVMRPLGAILAGVFIIVSVIAVVPQSNESGGGNPMRKSIALMMDADLSTLAALTKESEMALKERLKQHGISAATSSSTVRQIAEASHEDPTEILSVLLASTSEGER